MLQSTVDALEGTRVTLGRFPDRGRKCLGVVDARKSFEEMQTTGNLEGSGARDEWRESEEEETFRNRTDWKWGSGPPLEALEGNPSS